MNTITYVSTARLATSRRSNSTRHGITNTNNDSYWQWLTKRGPRTLLLELDAGVGDVHCFHPKYLLPAYGYIVQYY